MKGGLVKAPHATRAAHPWAALRNPVFSIHMFVLLWSGSFAFSAGNPTVGPAACAAPGEEKSSSRACETRGTFQLEHPLIAGALKVTDGGADHRKDTMIRPAMSKSRLPLVIKAGFCALRSLRFSIGARKGCSGKVSVSGRRSSHIDAP